MSTTFDPIQLTSYATEMLSLHDPDGRFVTSTPLSVDLLGQPADELSGRRLSDLVHPEDARSLELAFEGIPTTCRLRHADGNWAWLEVTVRPAPDSQDGSTLVTTRPAEALVAARQSALWAEETLRQVFDNAPTPMAMLGLDNRFERVNPAFCAMLDSDSVRLVGRSLSEVSETAESPGERFALGELVSGRVDQLNGNLSFRRVGQPSVLAVTRRTLAHSASGRQHVVLHVLSVREGAATGAPQVLVLPEQTRLAVTLPTLREAARSVRSGPVPTRADQAKAEAADPVTGLTSRTLLLDRLNLAVARKERETHFLVMFFVELSGTAKILDRHGRRSLEAVMGSVGNRLRAAVRGEDTVARFGDGGFVVLCPLVVASADIVTRRQLLGVAIADGPVLAEGRKFKLTSTIGAAVIGPREGCDAGDLLARADEAMAAAVSPGRR